jgi:hypothetical protein
LEAEIILKYNDAKVAAAIAEAVSPDNFKTPTGLSIKTTNEARKVITQIRCSGKLPTFIATIDDLLFCVSVAERALQMTRKLE